MHVQVYHDVFYHIAIYAIDIVQMHKMLLPDLKYSMSMHMGL